MSLDSIVNVTITRETKVPSQQGFGFGNFVSNSAVFLERVKSYASSTEVSDDALSGASTVAFAGKYFGQAIRPTALYVTKKGRDLASIQVLDFDADFITGNTIDLEVNDVAITQTPFNTDQATTLGDLATNIQANADVVSAVATGARQITVTGAVNGPDAILSDVVVAGGASQAGSTITPTQYSDTLAAYDASLSLAENINNDWYAIAIESRLVADILLVQAWTESRTKIFFATNNDADVLTSGTGDIASQLKALAVERTSYLYSDDQSNWPEAAWMGGQLPNDPGSITWAYKTLVGVLPDDLTGNEKSNALGKNANVYTTLNDINITEEGKMGGGEYIDVIRGADYIQVRIQENVYRLLANAPKVPFTDSGISLVVDEVRAVLKRAADVNQIILPDFEITFPDAADVPIADKGNRLLPDIEFTATLQGAIHKTTINGTLQL